MTDPAAAPRDIQRPLDEGMPPAAGGAVPALRPAVPDGHPETADDAGHARAPMARTAPETTTTTADHPAGAPPSGRARRALRAVLLWTWRGLREVAAWPRRAAAWSRRPTGRLVVPSTLVLTLLAGSAVAGAVVVPKPLTGKAAPPGRGVSPPRPPEVAPLVPPTLPGLAPSPGPPLERPSDVLRGWAQQMSVRTGIPAVALQAYGYAELVVAQTTPGCRLSWTTLAAIGRVESNHGSFGGATLQSDGRAWPEIFGPALDGQGGRELVRDTDGGRLDRDPVYDRAVGPMQFLPQTWERERVDATGEGLTDPHNIHDAALAAANYLCRNGRDLSSPEDWWAAILSYNNVQEYAEEVFAAAHDYGRRSR